MTSNAIMTIKAPLAFAAVGSGNVAAASVLTYSVTVPAGSNRAMIVGVSYIDLVAGTATISTVTYNGVAMTLVTGSLQTAILAALYDIGVAHYVLPAQDVGTFDVVVTMSESCDGIFSGAQCYTGAHQTVPTGTAAIATGTTTTPTVDVTSAVGEIVVAVVGAVDDLGAFASADTPRWEEGGGAGQFVGAGSSAAGAATVTMDFTGSTTATEWVISGVSLKPA